MGFLIGLILAVDAFFLAGIGHGTYSPAIANVSILAFIPVLGILIAAFGPPFLWAFYFVLVPKIVSRTKRIIALALITLLHPLAGLWWALGDSATNRALQQQEGAVWSYCLTLVFAITGLAFISAKVAGKKDSQL